MFTNGAMRPASRSLLGTAIALAFGCSGSSPASDGASTSTGGTSPDQITGGASSGNLGIGGSATGGVAPTGGSNSTTGGAAPTGGLNSGTGGATAVGGAATGGKSDTGGARTGGNSSTGGVNPGIGGAPATGGKASIGGASTGGAPSPTGGSATAGAASGGNAGCFPALTDFASKAGGFGSAQRQIAQIGTGDSVSLFRPADASFGKDGCKHPLLVWGNGSTNTVDIWAGHLSRAASFGFVVVAPEQTQVTSKQMNDALDYVIQLSQDSSNSYYNKVDTSRIGSTGYSLGGMGAMQVAANARIGATFIWDSFGTSSALHGPLGGIFAESGISSNWATMIDGCPFPSFGMQAAGTSHTSILGFPGTGLGGGGTTPYAQEAYVGWFRWHFMGDPAAKALFAGDSCGFCTRQGITVHSKSIN